MNIVNKLTLRSLKQNKRRTWVTIIGVVISVAMITAVASLSVSFLDLMKKQTIAQSGFWHYNMSQVNEQQLEAIKTDNETSDVIVSRELGYANLEGSDNRSRPYLFLMQYNPSGFEHFQIKLLEGRLPADAQEIIISDEIARTAKVQLHVGDQLKLAVGQRWVENNRLDQNSSVQKEDGKVTEKLIPEQTNSYTIVGIMERPAWERAWSPGYTVVSFLDEKTVSAAEPADAFIILKHVNKALYEHAQTLGASIGVSNEAIHFHSDLLRYYGITSNDNVRSVMFLLSSIIIAIIMLGSVSLIYNAFAISVAERSRYLGMLSSVGATKQQKRNSVFFEGAVIGLISIPVGIASGLLGIWITFKFINKIIQGALGMTETLTLVVTPMSIIAACAVSLVTIFISTYVPARRASRITAIDAIRQVQDVKLTGKTVRTSRFIRKLFGLEAEIGLKNLKRNKRKYQATVLSLVISIILFMSVSYFTDTLKKSVTLSQAGINFDIKAAMYDGDQKEKNFYAEELQSMPAETAFTAIEEFSLSSRIAKNHLPDSLKERVQEDGDRASDGSYRYYITVYAMDDESLQKYADETGVDLQALLNPDAPAAIVVDMNRYQDELARKYVERKGVYFNKGDTFSLEYYDYDSETDYPLLSVRVEGLTSKQPMGAFSPGMGGLNIVVSERIADQLVQEQLDINRASMMYMRSSDPMTTVQAIEDKKYERIHVQNLYQSRERENQMLLLMKVFTYGFISLITAISVANILNTISTSISLRKREFAMLKSIGMTPGGFNKMIRYESIFYGIKALLYGLPLSGLCMYLIYLSVGEVFSYSFQLPWLNICGVVIAVFLIVLTAMTYASSKVKKENIIDALKQENI